VELGRQLAAANRFEAARDAFELSLMRSSDVRGARTGLARLYAATDPERAMKFLRDELAEHPALAEAYLVMGWLHMMYGAESDADRALERGRQVASDKAAFDEEADELLSRLQD
jgi:Tfp pilus assembly protein PilF